MAEQSNANPGGPMRELPDVDRPASSSPTDMDLVIEMPAGSRTAGRDPYAALRYPNFWLYQIGWILSVLGRQVQTVAVQWQLTQRTPGNFSQSSLSLGLIGGVQALPVLLLSLHAGQLADRFDRRRIVIWGAFAAVITSLGLSMLTHEDAPVGWIYLLLGLNSTALAIAWPARSALLPQIVPPASFANAMTWTSSAFQVASVVGPAIGGIVVSYTISGAYLIDAACTAAFGLFLLMMTLAPMERAPQAATASGVVAGVRFVWSTKIILATITLDLFAVLFGGATALLPLYATILHVGVVGFGWLKTAPAVGAFSMALILAHAPPMKRAGLAMLISVAGFGAATIVFGLSHWFMLSLLMLALTGAFDNVSVVVRQTLVQMLTPDSMRGRVSAVNNIFIGASNQLGELESGLVGWRAGPVVSVVSGGIGTLLVVAGVAAIWPQVRRFGSLEEARPIEESPPLAETRPLTDASDA